MKEGMSIGREKLKVHSNTRKIKNRPTETGRANTIEQEETPIATNRNAMKMGSQSHPTRVRELKLFLVGRIP